MKMTKSELANALKVDAEDLEFSYKCAEDVIEIFNSGIPISSIGLVELIDSIEVSTRVKLFMMHKVTSAIEAFNSAESEEDNQEEL